MENQDTQLKDTPQNLAKDVKREDPDIDISAGEPILLEEVDPALAAKIHLVNEAINQIGFTGYHWKLFGLSGFGFAVDSLMALSMSVANPQVVLQYQPSYKLGALVALYIGSLVGALFWGITADIIGRKWSFNISLLVAAIFTIISGASPNYVAYSTFVALTVVGAGGNIVLDTTCFLEYLPAKHQWLVTLMAAWWGIGQTSAGLLGWAFLPNFSCSSDEPCTYSNNMGWRYVYYTGGGLVLLMSLLRVTVVRFHETPKYLICSGEDEKAVKILHDIAQKYGRQCDLTLEQLTRHGQVRGTQARTASPIGEVWSHLKGLFATKKLGFSTSLVWLSWTIMGLCYPLFYVFLPSYLASRGAQFGQLSVSVTWRNYTLAQVSAIFGPVLAAYMCRVSFIGRKRTMAVGALLSMAFLFAYTAVRSNTENVGLNCAVSFFINVYYGTLYAYTPEVLPSSHRGTGNGTAIAFNRIMGAMSAVVATYGDTTTAAPIYVCAGLFGLLGVISILLPFEPQHTQSI